MPRPIVESTAVTSLRAVSHLSLPPPRVRRLTATPRHISLVAVYIPGPAHMSGFELHQGRSPRGGSWPIGDKDMERCYDIPGRKSGVDIKTVREEPGL